jgi:(1->4)-alpha-D-glucan 1-alpha-D-glucosylmutase
MLSLLAEQDRQARDVPRKELQKIIGEVIARLPVYRTYSRGFEVSPRDRACLDRVIEEVDIRPPSFDPQAVAFVRRVLLLDLPPDLAEDQKKDWLRFVMRWQQFTGPIMAKGLEDTALYVYNPLISLNEVGTDFLVLASADFHHFNRCRRDQWPATLNATSTHDTKRSEDVRMRLNVLSEIPHEWEGCLTRWTAWNQPRKRQVQGRAVPAANEEYFLYQTLLGAWPLVEEDLPEFKERLQAYVFKAAREAKVHTRWIAPNHEHEHALMAFLQAILDESNHREFLDDFKEFQARLAYYGALNSISQVLLKIASPGVPDFYQGTELWDFSLVDPDNRRPVDFQKRARLLKDLRMKERKKRETLFRELLANWKDGALKLYVTYKALNFRKAHPDIFLKGDYVPLATKGPQGRHVVAFARQLENTWVIAGVVRLFTGLLAPGDHSFREGIWERSFLPLPLGAPEELVNIFTGKPVKPILHGQSRSVPLADLFQTLPVFLLFGHAA